MLIHSACYKSCKLRNLLKEKCVVDPKFAPGGITKPLAKPHRYATAPAFSDLKLIFGWHLPCASILLSPVQSKVFLDQILPFRPLQNQHVKRERKESASIKSYAAFWRIVISPFNRHIDTLPGFSVLLLPAALLQAKKFRYFSYIGAKISQNASFPVAM